MTGKASLTSMGLVLLVLAGVLPCAGTARAAESHPMMDKLADSVIHRYQTSSCQQLAMQKHEEPTAGKAQVEQRVLDMLHNDPQMRAAFLNRVAPPIANKLFECGMIP